MLKNYYVLYSSDCHLHPPVRNKYIPYNPEKCRTKCQATYFQAISYFRGFNALCTFLSNSSL